MSLFCFGWVCPEVALEWTILPFSVDFKSISPRDEVISLNYISIVAFIRKGPLNTAVIYMQSEALFCWLCRLLCTQRCAPPP